MKSTFSALNRSKVLQEMADAKLDLLVIGGGITGAGIVWDASKRGIHSGVVEMHDFASGTSSRSTKLVHGGLRYLKQGEIKLVMEVGRERAILHKNAPHLVVPVPMLLPIYKGGAYGYWAASIGLYIYDLLAGVKRNERRRMLNKQRTLELEPLLKTTDLIGAGYYYEYRTNDARLTVEVVKNACAHGALIANYAKAGEFIYKDGKVAGVKVEDLVTGRIYDIFAQKIVNAAGPWVDQIREQDHSLQGKRLLLTKGVHLVVGQKRLPIRQAAYFGTMDNRMIFVIPRGTKTYIGTTDTIYQGNIQEPRTSRDDLDYLLQAVNAIFPTVELRPEDVESNWAGLRPLIYEDGKGPSEISRKDEIFLSDSGLITIAGGKLTGFRKMAEKVVHLVAKQLRDTSGVNYPGCTTDKEAISGGDRGGCASYEEYAKELVRQGDKLGLQAAETEYLLALYGSNVVEIFGIFEQRTAGGRAHKSGNDWVRAEVEYCVLHEMTVTALDFLMRRTGLIYFDRQRAEEIATVVIDMMSEMFQWDLMERKRQHDLVVTELAAAVNYDKAVH